MVGELDNFRAVPLKTFEFLCLALGVYTLASNNSKSY